MIFSSITFFLFMAKGMLKIWGMPHFKENYMKTNKKSFVTLAMAGLIAGAAIPQAFAEHAAPEAAHNEAHAEKASCNGKDKDAEHEEHKDGKNSCKSKDGCKGEKKAE